MTGVPTAPTVARAARARAESALVLGAAVATGLALRLVHLHAVMPIVLADEAPVGLDRWLNTQIATAVARGEWDGGWAAAYDSSPGYSYVLAGLYALAGGHWLGPLLVQVALGACAPLLLFHVGRALHSRAVGLLAAVLASLYTPAVFYEALLVKFSLVPVVLAGVLCGAVVARRRPGAGAALVTGFACGLLVLLRPNTAVAVPVVGGWIVARRSARDAARLLAALACGAMLVLGPLALRDRLAAERGLASSLWGIHFYVGTNPRADGEYVPIDGVRADVVGHVIDAREIGERAAGRSLTPAEVSWHWFGAGLDFVRAHPGRYVLLEARKLWLAFAAEERGSFGDEFAELARVSPVLRLPLVSFGVVGPLGLLGLCMTLRRRGPALLPVLVGVLAASLLPFFVVGRYRLPLAPPMIVLAAVALVELEAWGRRRGRGALVLSAIGLGAVAIALGAKDPQLLGLLLVLAVGLLAAADFRRAEDAGTNQRV